MTTFDLLYEFLILHKEYDRFKVILYEGLASIVPLPLDSPTVYAIKVSCDHEFVLHVGIKGSNVAYRVSVEDNVEASPGDDGLVLVRNTIAGRGDVGDIHDPDLLATLDGILICFLDNPKFWRIQLEKGQL